MSGSARWFDLSEFGAKLERRGLEGSPHFELVLEVPAARLEPLISQDPDRTMVMELLDLGWKTEPVGEDRYRLTNHAPMNRKSEIVSALRTFFAEGEIEASHVSVHSLRQGERVEGLQARRIITEAELSRDIDGVEPADFDRISASVRRAQELQAERQRRQTQVLFHGKGRDLFNHVTDLVMERHGFSEAEAAYVTIGQMVLAQASPRAVHSVRLTDLAAALEKGPVEEVQVGGTYMLSRMAASPQAWEALRSRVQASPDFQVMVRHAEAPEVGPLVSARDAVLARVGMELSPEVMDRVEVAVPVEEAFDYYRERLPFMVIRDTSVPTRVLAQNMAAIAAALDVVAEELEVPRDALIPDQSTVPLRFSYDAIGSGAIGYLRSIDTPEQPDEESGRMALTMNISVTKGRSFTHELGHLVDRGNRITAEERHGILARSGVLADAQAAVSREWPEGGEYADYLLKEPEVFARAFDAHFINVVRARGDQELRALGGMQTTNGFDLGAPTGDLEKSSAFLRELKDVLSLRREARHKARQQAKVEASPEVKGSMSFQP